MRISVHKNDPHYHGLAFLCQVFIDDEKLDQCFAADDVGGWCDVYVLDEIGNCIVNNREIKIERLRGDVSIVLPEAYRDDFEDMRGCDCVNNLS